MVNLAPTEEEIENIKQLAQIRAHLHYGENVDPVKHLVFVNQFVATYIADRILRNASKNLERKK